MNEAVKMAEEIWAEGWSIDYIRVERRGRMRWAVFFGINSMVPLGEGDDDRVSVDRANCPSGVTIGGFERVRDRELDVCCSEEQMEAIMGGAAEAGESYDLVRTDGETPDYPHWATKPMRWNRKWAKRDGRWVWAADHKIVLGRAGKAVREA